jgi:hypothetical protein
MEMTKVPSKLIAIVVLAVMMTACANQPYAPSSTPGFFLGLWHGFSTPISFVGSLLMDDVRIYAFPNSGRWYDFGFLIGLTPWGFLGHKSR